MNKLTEAERHGRGTKARISRAQDPELEAQKPRMPRDLAANARQTWKQLILLLDERGTLTAGDALLVRAYAETEARQRAAQQALDIEGMVITTMVLDKSGRPVSRSKPSPYLAIVERCERMLHLYRRDLGLAPITRDRVKRLVLEERPGESMALKLLRMEKRSVAGSLRTH